MELTSSGGYPVLQGPARNLPHGGIPNKPTQINNLQKKKPGWGIETICPAVVAALQVGRCVRWSGGSRREFIKSNQADVQLFHAYHAIQVK